MIKKTSLLFITFFSAFLTAQMPKAPAPSSDESKKPLLDKTAQPPAKGIIQQLLGANNKPEEIELIFKKAGDKASELIDPKHKKLCYDRALLATTQCRSQDKVCSLLLQHSFAITQRNNDLCGVEYNICFYSQALAELVKILPAECAAIEHLKALITSSKSLYNQITQEVNKLEDSKTQIIQQNAAQE